jgi:hypothetical protein
LVRALEQVAQAPRLQPRSIVRSAIDEKPLQARRLRYKSRGALLQRLLEHRSIAATVE